MIIDKIINWLERRELAKCRLEIANLKKDQLRISYLESRDKLCSELANKLNKALFENAKLKGLYNDKR